MSSPFCTRQCLVLTFVYCTYSVIKPLEFSSHIINNKSQKPRTSMSMKFCTFLYILLRYWTSRNNNPAATRKNISDRGFCRNRHHQKIPQSLFIFNPSSYHNDQYFTIRPQRYVSISATLAILSLYHPTFRFSQLLFFQFFLVLTDSRKILWMISTATCGQTFYSYCTCILELFSLM